ncbi:hypothetical protein UP25_09735 [Vibrio parahaemolyticus]|nr:hypothetical protein UP25_09735 [Vibrio parahaemolyticus]
MDRFGQNRDIAIHFPSLKGPSQAILARWFDEGLNAFAETGPTGRAVYDKYSDALIEILESGDTSTLDEIIEE